MLPNGFASFYSVRKFGDNGPRRWRLWLRARFGATLAAGDFDSDGVDDLAVGAPRADGGEGAVFVFPGSAAGINTGFEVGDDDDDFDSLREGFELFGAALTAEDFNGDEFADLAVGAPGDDGSSGAVFVLPGSAAGITTGFVITQADAGEVDEAGDLFGAALAVGDWDADGISDLAVGAPGEAPGPWPKSGIVFLFRGTETGIRTEFGEDEAVSDFNFFYIQTGFGGENEEGDRFGAALVTGDFNGEEERGLAVGAPGEAPGLDPAQSGAVNFIPASELVP